MKKILRDYAILFLIAGVIVALDQFSKSYIRGNFALGDVWSPWPWLMPYARVVNWYNTGVAFGMFQGRGDLFTILAIVVALAIIYYYPRVPSNDRTLRIAMGMQLGGALGNVVDRIFYKQVTDFISIGNFPVFNLADASITLGVVILVLGVLVQEMQLKKEKQLVEQSALEEAPPIEDNHE